MEYLSIVFTKYYGRLDESKVDIMYFQAYLEKCPEAIRKVQWSKIIHFWPTQWYRKTTKSSELTNALSKLYWIELIQHL